MSGVNKTIKSDIVRYFRMNNLKTKSGEEKASGTAYTIAYSYNPGIGRVRYGACKFSKTQLKEKFSKKAHRSTALARYTKYPVLFDMCFDLESPSQVLHEVRECIKKMIFTVGMKCRHSSDLAVTTNPFEWTIKVRDLQKRYVKHSVTLVPMNAELTTRLPDSPKSKKVEWDEVNI